MFIFLVAILNGLAALGLQLIINNLDSLGMLYGFLLSLLVYPVAGAASVAKEKTEMGLLYVIGTLLTTILTFGILSPAARPFLNIWNTTESFWTKALLVWLALIAACLVWVALKKPGE